jgi:adenylate cyclase
MTFVATHLINHALGVFGVETMAAMQDWRVEVWRSWPGTVLLYGSAAIHAVLALWRVVWRSTWRMPLLEALQIMLGLSIPLLVYSHVIGTRLMVSQAGFDDNYGVMLRILWPGLALSQTIMLVVVWTHGVIGVYFVLHPKAWFRRARGAFMLAAVMLPVLALAGFVAGGREAARLPAEPIVFSPRHLELYAAATSLAAKASYAVLAALAVALAIRALRRRRLRTVSVRFAGHGPLRSPKGLTLLEMSRLHRLPHASACGGRGRCATCRVMVIGGGESLPPPNDIESRTLERIRAPRHVRLACQIRPEEDLIVRSLLPARADDASRLWHATPLEWGEERKLTILFADLRGFSNLALFQPPDDLMRLLGRVIDELTQATERRGGRVALIETDGIMAVFGLGGSAGAAARGAIEASADILRAIDHVNADAALGISQPLRVGIGVHMGSVIASDVGDAEHGFQLTVIGSAVVIADRLEEATKEHAADCLISLPALQAAGLGARAGRTVNIAYKNGDAPMPAAVFGDLAALERLLSRSGASRDLPASPEAASPIPGDSIISPDGKTSTDAEKSASPPASAAPTPTPTATAS